MSFVELVLSLAKRWSEEWLKVAKGLTPFVPFIDLVGGTRAVA